MKHLLVTGGNGFIGSNFIPWFLEAYPDYALVNLDLLTYAGKTENLAEVAKHPRYHFVKGDIANRELVEYLFMRYDFRGVLHFAAESHVDNSIHSPEQFVHTNVNGTFTLLDVARNHWLSAPNSPREGYENARFLHVSTDEVYGTLGETGKFTETTPYAPNSPYSASKAASDMLVRSYFHTYGMNVVTTNCSNNFGPKQHDEKLIPVIIRKCVEQASIPIYGDGKNIRDWLYVLDHGKGIATAFLGGRAGETYNIGADNERNNLQIVSSICSIMDEVRPLPDGRKHEEFITFVKDRPGHDRRYAIDATKIKRELGWGVDFSFTERLRETVNWYVAKYTGKTVSSTTGEGQPSPIETPKPQQEPPHAAKKQAEIPKREPIHTHKAGHETHEEAKTPPTDAPKTRYDHLLLTKDLNEALEGLAEVKAAIKLTQEQATKSREKATDTEARAVLLMRKAKEGSLSWDEANDLAMKLLDEQKEAEQKAKQSDEEVKKLEELAAQMEELLQKLRELKSRPNLEDKIPDSSDTYSMLERMKQKVLKNEILSDLYKSEAESKDGEDPSLIQKVDDILGLDKEKRKKALEDFKKSMGFAPPKEDDEPKNEN